MKKLLSIMSNLQIHFHFKLYFQEEDQHTECKLSIHGTNHRKDNNQLQSLELPCRYPGRESKHGILIETFV